MSRRKSRSQQKINTSSLPDIIFMILFFFMVVGKFPAPQPQIDVVVPVQTTGKEIKQNTSLDIYIGKKDIQIGYDIVKGDFTTALKKFKKANPKKKNIILRVDKDVEVEFINTVIKPALRSAGFFKYVIQTENVLEKKKV